MVYLFLANGFEEIEALTPVDVLRRAGVNVKTVSIGDTTGVMGAHGIEVKADMTLDGYNESNAEMIILPGGSDGTKNLGEHPKMKEIILSANKRGIYIAAICAAPTILAKLGLHGVILGGDKQALVQQRKQRPVGKIAAYIGVQGLVLIVRQG